MGTNLPRPDVNAGYTAGEIAAFQKIAEREAGIKEPNDMTRTFDALREGREMEDEHLRNAGRRGRKLPSLPL